MPLDKMPNSEEFMATHNSVILHVQGTPVFCIVDEKSENYLEYENIKNDSSLRASLVGFLNKDDELGLLMGFKLKIQTNDNYLEYTVYPNDECIDAIIFTESIFIINKKLENLFSIQKIITDQFVKTKSEFDKFKKMTK